MKMFIFISSILLSNATFALPNFSPEEIARHQQQVGEITKIASDCLDDTYKDHVDFFKKWGVSKFYGDRRPDYSSQAGRAAALRKYGAPAHLIDDLEAISCIGLTLRCLEKGFTEVGSSDTWKKIKNFLYIDQKVYGTDLQRMLQQLGWKIYYWNPDPTQNARWDEEDRRLTPLAPGKQWMPVWGGHSGRYNEVRNKGSYYGVRIDDATSLVGFKDQTPYGFNKVSFFVGTAHSGYHVFPGRLGDVIEAHSMRDLNSIDNLEFSVFNPLGSGGGPRWTRTERYRSGMIVVPPIAN